MTHRLRVLMGAALLTSAAGLAQAADLPSRVAPAYVPPPVVPVFTWSGPYFGVNAGYVFDSSSRFTTTGVAPANVTSLATGARPASVKLNDNGVTAGGQIGYNWQFIPGSGFLVGVEADAAYTDLQKSNTIVGTTGANNVFRSGLDYLGTVRGRAGWVWGQTLFYGTGGFAYGNVNNRVTLNNAANTAALFSGSRSDMQTGWAAGGGVEFAMPAGSFLSFLNFGRSSAMTVKLEYLHYDLGNRTLAVNALAGTPAVGGYTTKIKTDGDLARIGLNYKF